MARTYVKFLSELSGPPEPNCGHKVAQLAKLMREGLPVPDGFCVVGEAYLEHIVSAETPACSGNERDYWPLVQAPRNLREVELNPVLVREVQESYAYLLDGTSGPVAVRSSATAEDLPGHSFAGIYDTVLNVRDEPSLLNAIRHCWNSYWSEEAVLYRDVVGINHAEHAMPVLVQRMVQARFAGVIFTRDQIHQNKENMVIELVQGSGEALVGGAVAPTRYIVNRETRRSLEQSRRGVGLDPQIVDRLVSLGLEVERLQGCPQDIEWCLDESNHIWILQTRSITGTASAHPASEAYSPKGFIPLYNERLSPLGCDLAVRRYNVWVQAINDYNRTSFKPCIRSADGLLSHNPVWRSARGKTKLWMKFWKTVRWLGAEGIYREYTAAVLPTHLERLSETSVFDLSTLSNVNLLKQFDDAIEAYLDLQRASYPMVGVAITSGDMLDRLCRLLFRSGTALRASDFLSGLDNLTVARDVELHQLARALGEVLGPDEIVKLDQFSLSELKSVDNPGQKLVYELETLLDRYGYVWADRYPRDPAWQLDHQALAAFLTHAAQVPPGEGLPALHSRQVQRRAEAIEEAARRLSARGPLRLRWLVFRWCLNRAGRFFPHKENRNHFVYQSMMVIRKYAQEIGRRLSAQGVLQSPQDVFFLTWEEIREAMRAEGKGEGKGARFLELVQERRDTYSNVRPRVVNEKPGYRGVAQYPINGDVVATELAGEGCSPGIVAGPARLIRGLGELYRVEAGDIVVSTTMRPAWSTVFAKAGGVVIESGGLLSHGATLAREYSVPAVFNIPGVTQIIREGDWLTVDGGQGIVTIHN